MRLDEALVADPCGLVERDFGEICQRLREVHERDLRIEQLLEPGSFEETATGLRSTDPLGFIAVRAYAERLEAARRSTGLEDACVVGTGRIGEHKVVFGASDSRFLRGSMGSVVGEKFTRAVELATELPKAV